MIKNSLVLLLILLLSNCGPHSSALLGPALTGVTTGSVSQASLSFGTNQVVRKIKEASIKTKNEVKKVAKKIEDFDIEIKSKDFYASVKKLYLQDKHIKKKTFIIHR